MRRFTVLLVSVLVLAAYAAAQMEPPKHIEVPKTEFYAGYAYQHADTSGINAETGGTSGANGPVSGIIDVNAAGLNGFVIEFAHYLRHSNFGYTIDLAHGSDGRVNNSGVKYSRSSYMVGPSYRFHDLGFFTPSIHALGGLDHDDFTDPENGTVLHYRSTDAAAAGGVTFDANFTKHIAIRLGQVDYIYTHHFGTNQSSFRYTAGAVFRF